MFDPRIQNADGTLKPYGPDRADYDEPILYAYDSAQKFPFPVPAKALKKKLARLESLGVHPEMVNGKLVISPESPGFEGQDISFWEEEGLDLIRQFPGFQLTIPSKDNSSYKWDGQIDVAKMDLLHNREVQRYVGNAMGYWTAQTRNNYLEIISDALAQAPGGSKAELVEAITQHSSEKESPLTYKILNEPQAQYLSFEAPEVIAQRFESLKKGPQTSTDGA